MTVVTESKQDRLGDREAGSVDGEFGADREGEVLRVRHRQDEPERVGKPRAARCSAW